jgi:hypothetical protein
MDIIYVLIGFVCGFLCRQVILYQQMARAKAEFIKDFEQFIKEKQNGD